MKDQNNIEELFRTSLENFEADVNPALWDKIEAGISANPVSVPSGAASAGKSIVGGWIAGSAAVIAVVGITSYFLITNQNAAHNKIEATQTIAPVKDDAEIKTGSQKLTNEAEVASDNKSNAVSEITQPEIESSKASTKKLPVTESAAISSENKTVSAGKPSEINKNNTVSDKLSESTHQSDAVPQTVANQNPNPSTIAPAEVQQSQDAAPVESNSSNAANTTNNQTTNNSLGTLPNIFTPNGDGLNDLFMVKPVDVKSFTVTIFDRSGKVIHSWNNPFGFWDGLLKNGEQAPQGTYFYSIVAESTDGTVLKKQSSITLKR